MARTRKVTIKNKGLITKKTMKKKKRKKKARKRKTMNKKKIIIITIITTIILKIWTKLIKREKKIQSLFPII